MTNLLRMTLAASVAAVTLTSVPAVAAPTSSSNGPATARARIVKPLTLTRTSHMDFGDIVVQDAGVATLAMGGALSCTGGLTCAATGTPAAYLVTGTNNQVVTVTAPDVSLTNAANPGTQRAGLHPAAELRRDWRELLGWRLHRRCRDDARWSVHRRPRCHGRLSVSWLPNRLTRGKGSRFAAAPFHYPGLETTMVS